MIHTDPHSPIAPARISAFVLLLLTPYIFPGLFPFDVNLALAVAAAALFISITMMKIAWLYISKPLCIVFLILLAIQLMLFSSGALLAPESWRLQLILYFMVILMLVIGTSVPSFSLIYWMKSYILIATTWGFTGLFVWLGGTAGEALQIGSVTLAMPPTIKIAGPFNQGNVFATAIGFAWLFSHWFFIQERKPVYLIAIIFFTALLFDTLSRGGWIAYLITISLLLISLKPNRTLLLGRLTPTWIVGLLLGAIFLEFRIPLVDSEGISFITETASYSFTARLFIWGAAITEFMNSPFTGVGWGQFQVNFWVVKPETITWLHRNLELEIPFNSIPYSAHNIFLHILAEAGLIAFLAFFWASIKFISITLKLISKGDSSRLPFALAVLAFLLQSQINIPFQRPMILLLTAFFAGIALAPWLWKNSWKLRLNFSIKSVSLISSCLIMIWASQLSYQWFKTEQAILNLDLNDRASVQNMVELTTHPRMSAISLTWLGYVVAQKRQHRPLLQWLQPYLITSVFEVPSLLAHQVLFYSFYYSQNYDEACRIGKLILSQKISLERNSQVYENICKSRPINNYTFGY